MGEVYGRLRVIKGGDSTSFNSFFQTNVHVSYFEFNAIFSFVPLVKEREDICCAVSADWFPFQEFTGKECVTCVRLSAYYNLSSSSKMIHICRAEDGEVFQVCPLQFITYTVDRMCRQMPHSGT